MAPNLPPAPHAVASALTPTMQQWLQGMPAVAKELLAGGAAGAVAKTCVAPLERVKILFQTGRMRGQGVGATLHSIAASEGVAGLFKGNGASVLRIVPYSALHFGAYEHYRNALAVAMGCDGGRVPPRVDLAAGAAAGATAVVVTYPLDLVRTRLAYQTEGGRHPPGLKGVLGLKGAMKGAQSQPSSVRGVLAATVAAEGVAGLYRGMGPTLVGILPYAGLKFYVYQKAKAAHRAREAEGAAGGGGPGRGAGDGAGRGYDGAGHSSAKPATPAHRLSVPTMLLYGAASGLVAQTATYPLDVVRRQMQVQGLHRLPGGAAAAASAASAGPLAARLPPFTSTLHGLRSVAAAGGVRALFAGVSINYLKVVPSTAIGFTVYDALKQYLDLPHNL